MVLPQESKLTEPPPETISVTVTADSFVRIKPNGHTARSFARTLEGDVWPSRVAFLQADRSLAFHAVAQVLDLMHSAGAASVGLLTSELEKNR